jgi:hypothetical protein
MNETLHLCIVSEQLLANLIPALMLRPQQVLLATSEEMAQRGFTRRLAGLLAARGFAVAVKEGLPSGGLSGMVDFARSWVEEAAQAHPQASRVLNITGGNKLMTIAFLQALWGRVDDILYTDTAHGVLEQLAPPRGASTLELTGVLDVPLYLAAQGMAYREAVSDSADWRGRAQRRMRLTQHLGREAPTLGSFLGRVNWLANAALGAGGDVLVAPRQRFDRPPLGRWRAAIRGVDEAEVARFDGGCGLEFADAEGARYLGGGWLEEYAWHAARALGPDDVRMGVTGDWEDTERGRNELDLVVVHRNRLLLMECKTLRLGRTEQGDTELMYKLDSVGDDVRGLFGEVVLLSARQPSRIVVDRAEHHRIRVVGPDRLGRLKTDIAAWMRTGRFPPA